MQDIVITGEWDGKPIWRPKTSSEKLSEELEKVRIARELAKANDNKTTC